MTGLHPVQQKLLKLLRDNTDEPLSIRQLQDEIDASSPSVVQHHLLQLEKKGYLRKNPANPRDYVVLEHAPDKDFAYINMYGMAQCGPSGQLLDGSPVDRIPIYTQMLGFPSPEAFLVKARGNSMQPKINPGDLVIVRKANDAENGQIAVCVNEGEVLIKKIQKIPTTKGNVTYNLISLNPEIPAFLASDEFHIEGIVKGVYKYSV